MANDTQIKFKGLSDMELAQKVMNGEFGNGVDRQNALGDRYGAVQNIINNGMKMPTEDVEISIPTQNTEDPPAEIINDLEAGISLDDTSAQDNSTNTEEQVQIENGMETQNVESTGNDGVLSEENLANINEASSQIQDFINQEPNPNLTPQQQNQNTAHDLVTNIKGWSEAEFNALVELWNHESGWSADARNSSSGAYGIPQALPASKMASAGSDYMTNPTTQIKWGLDYIQNRYGTPTAALNHWKSTGWY